MTEHIEIHYRGFTYDLPLPDKDNAYLAGEAVTALVALLQATPEPDTPPAAPKPVEDKLCRDKLTGGNGIHHVCGLKEGHTGAHHCVTTGCRKRWLVEPSRSPLPQQCLAGFASKEVHNCKAHQCHKPLGHSEWHKCFSCLGEWIS